MRNVPIELILLKIAEGLQTLVKNPDISQIIKDSHALNEAEEAKAQEARGVIANADKFLAEIKAKEDALADVNERVATAEQIEQQNNATLKDIDIKRRALETKAQANESVTKANEAKADELSELSDKLDARDVETANIKAEVEALKSDLKRRIDNIMKQAEGV